MMVAEYFEQLLAEAEAAKQARVTAAAAAAPAAARARPQSASASRPTKRHRGGVASYREDGAGDAEAPPPSSPAEPDLPWLETFEQAKTAQRSQAELSADTASLAVIRSYYGDMSERLICMLLTFDALFEFRKVMRLRFDFRDKEQFAILFAQAWA
eukprot:6175037-Pleurochrysis_carterae.AAC.1